jgi:hypothetical protein
MARLTVVNDCQYSPAMAIQFPCPACNQPIEVDDEWALRSVRCPFCRTTATAPESSTFAPAGDVPVASPAASVPPPALDLGQPQVPGNPLAWWALLSACAAVVAYLAANAVAGWGLMQLVGPEATGEEAQRAMMELAQAATLPSWVITFLVLLMAAFGFWVAGLVCGILAIRRPARRWMAIGSLVLSGLLPLLTCCGAAFSLWGGPAG